MLSKKVCKYPRLTRSLPPCLQSQDRLLAQTPPHSTCCPCPPVYLPCLTVTPRNGPPLDGDLLGSLEHLSVRTSTFCGLGMTWSSLPCVLEGVLVCKGTALPGCVYIYMYIFCFKFKPCSSAQQLTAVPNDRWPGTEPEPWLRSRHGEGQTCLAW